MRLMDSLYFTSAACMSCGGRIDHPPVALSNWQWRVRDPFRIRSIRGQQWRRSEGSGAQRRRHHRSTRSGHRGRTAGPAHAAMRSLGNAGQCRLSPRPVSFSAKVRALEDFRPAYLDRTSAAPPRDCFGRSASDKRVCVCGQSATPSPQIGDHGTATLRSCCRLA